MPDIGINKATNKIMTQPRISDEVQGKNAAKRVLDEVHGFKPLNTRTRGGWKLSAFYVANFLTAGLVGGVAALAANSQVMGKKRPEGMSKAWQDLGQTYLNATIGRDHEDYKTGYAGFEKDQKGKKISKKFAFEGSFRNVTKLWSGIGSAILAPLGIARLVTARSQHKRAQTVFKQQFQSDVGRSPHPSALKSRSASELREMAGIGKDRSYKAAQHEVTDILKAKDRARKDNSSMAGRIGSKDVLTGSPNLKVQFARHLQEEFAPETLMGYDWVEKSTSHIKADDDVDPKQKLTKNQTPYQLKKWDIMKGNNVLIKTGSEYENNIPFALRNNWQRTVNDEDNGLLAYQQEYKQLTDEYDQKVKDRDSKNTPPEQKKVLQSQIDDLWQRIDDKQNELADPQLSKTIGGYMEKIGEHNYRLMQDAAARFGDKMDLRSPDA